jgi:hypothetical protein
MYIEHCNSLTERGNIIPIGKLQIIPREHEYYISLFPFDNSNSWDYLWHPKKRQILVTLTQTP